MGNLGQAMAEEEQCICCGEYAGKDRDLCLKCDSKDDFQINEDMMIVKKPKWRWRNDRTGKNKTK